MIDIRTQGAYLHNGNWLDASAGNAGQQQSPEAARRGTIAYRILKAHSKSDSTERLAITFDSLTSHDITYVGIVQTARASGMKSFPVPYVLTNCHNSLCAVGGTINEDDHLFGLSAVKKYGGDFVPTHMAVIHQYMREMFAGCGKMILGSDSHTRYGALGAMGVGEGGPELVKQLLGRTYDISMPEVVAVYLEGSPKPGVGPQDVALTLVKAVFKDGLVKNKVLEFVGPGVAGLSVDYRMGIDVMTTETTCLSSIWQTDDKVRDWLAVHGRGQDYAPLSPENGAWYDSVIRIDLSKVEPMIALPFHPSNAWPIKEFLANADDMLAQIEAEASKIVGNDAVKPDLRSKFKNGAFMVDQGIIAGCSGGTYENLVRAANILRGHSTGNDAFNLSIYPASQPQYIELVRAGLASAFMEAGATIRTAFCGPCFGAGDVPAHNAFSIRHTTRNFPNREGSKPTSRQIAYVALMDARSIAATAANGGKLTAATDLPTPPVETPCPYTFDAGIYDKRVYHGFGKANPKEELSFGPNIVDWPAMISLPENLILCVASAIYDPVTTTDELIPSGEAASYRSNPIMLSEFTLSRKDPKYVDTAKGYFALEEARRKMTGLNLGNAVSAAAPFTATEQEVRDLFASLDMAGQEAQTAIGSVVFAIKPGDGSAREQAAACQKVLGGCANIVAEYATKRYRSNLVNWGMLPFVLEDAASYNLQPGDRIVLTSIRQAIISGLEEVPAKLFQNGAARNITLRLPGLTKDERDVILAGCLINYYAQK